MLSIRLLKPILLVLCLSASGCHLFQPSPSAGAEKLPDLPKASRVVAEGESLAFQNGVITVEAVDQYTSRPAVSWTLRQGRETASHTSELGEYVRESDFLVVFQEPAGGMHEGGRSLVLARLFYLPDIISSPTAAREETTNVDLQKGEIAFFPGGFIVFEDAHENEFDSLGDDSAGIVLSTDGFIRNLEVEEFHTYQVGGKYLRMFDVFPGTMTSPGQLSAEIAPADLVWRGSTSREEVNLASGESVDVEELEIESAPVIAAGVDAQAYLRITADGAKSESFMLSPGQTVRRGKVAVRLDEATPDATKLTLHKYPEAQWPFQGRLPGVREVIKSDDPVDAAPEPTIVTQTVSVGESIEFYEARFELREVLDDDDTSLSDDMADFTIYHGGTYETAIIREGQSKTIHGNNRWWVMDVRSVDAQSNWGGHAVVKLRTGTYFRMGDRSGR